MRKHSSLILLFLVVLSCSSFFDDGIPSKNHNVYFYNKTATPLHISFSADYRVGGKTPILKTKDSTFVLAKGEYFRMINDAYDPGNTEPAYAHYHTLQEINDRIHKFEIFSIIGSDTTWATPDVLLESRWKMTDNDPISFGATYHSYFFDIQDSDF